MNKSVAFIPARAGSKGLPGKNKKLFFGKPLIQWTIEQAQQSKCFDKIVVSSDDEEVLKIATSCGVDTQTRHAELATDEAPIDAVLYDYFGREENNATYGCLLNPTSPLRSVKDIQKSYKYIKMKKYWSVASVQWSDFIGWVGMPSNKGPAPTYNLGTRPNRQSRDDYFLENGAIYWFEIEKFNAYGTIIANPLKIKLYEMPAERSLEIDTPFDWALCERAYEFTSMEKHD